MAHPRISILVPIYGTEAYIEKCSRSLFSQDYEDVQFIFVDDCTKDQAVQVLTRVLEEYPDRKPQTSIIRHPNNLGLGGARLTGLQHATGDYVWFVDSDDFIADHALRTLDQYMQEGYDLIAFSFIEESGSTSIQREIKELTIPNLLTDRVCPSIWKEVVKRSLMLDNEILPIVGLNFAEDLQMLYRLLLVAPKVVTLSSSFLYHYNVGNTESMMHNISHKSVLNLTEAVLIVYDFYQKQGKLRKYSMLIVYLLADCYLLLDTFESETERQQLLMQKIVSRSWLVSAILKSSLSSETKRKAICFYRNRGYHLYQLLYK